MIVEKQYPTQFCLPPCPTTLQNRKHLISSNVVNNTGEALKLPNLLEISANISSILFPIIESYNSFYSVTHHIYIIWTTQWRNHIHQSFWRKDVHTSIFQLQKTWYGFLKYILSFKFNLKIKTKHLTTTESLLTWEKISPNRKLLKEDNVDGSLACLSVSFHIIRKCQMPFFTFKHNFLPNFVFFSTSFTYYFLRKYLCPKQSTRESVLVFVASCQTSFNRFPLTCILLVHKKKLSIPEDSQV